MGLRIPAGKSILRFMTASTPNNPSRSPWATLMLVDGARVGDVGVVAAREPEVGVPGVAAGGGCRHAQPGGLWARFGGRGENRAGGTGAGGGARHRRSARAGTGGCAGAIRGAAARVGGGVAGIPPSIRCSTCGRTRGSGAAPRC